MIIQQSLFHQSAAGPPAVANVTTISSSSATVWTPPLPTHSSGQLINVFVAWTGNPTASVNTTNSVGTWVYNLVFSISTVFRGGWFRCATTGSNMSLEINWTATAGNPRAICYLIDNADSCTRATASTGTVTTSVNPPSHTIAVGARDAIWIPWAAVYGTAWTATSAPTNYSNLKTNTVSGGYGIASAERSILNTATEDPGTFSPTASGSWQASTFACYKA